MKRFVAALIDVYPQGSPTKSLAAQIGVSTRALPALTTGLRRYFKKLGLNFEELIEREKRFVDRKPVSIYSLTERGKEVLTK